MPHQTPTKTVLDDLAQRIQHELSSGNVGKASELNLAYIAIELGRHDRALAILKRQFTKRISASSKRTLANCITALKGAPA